MTIKQKLLALGFHIMDKDNMKYIFEKNDAKIIVTMQNDNDGNINYCKPFKVGSKTSSNFTKPEFIIHLAMVVELINIGYKAENIEIERKQPSGRGDERIDVLIKDLKGSPYMVLDAKTPKEYIKYSNQLRHSKGQIATYWQFFRSLKYLVAFTGDFTNEKFESEYTAINVLDWNSYSDLSEVQSKLKNIVMPLEYPLSDRSTPYQFNNSLKAADLKEIDRNNVSYIYTRILEILRTNGISDKTNAFNKILNLFIAKIFDEEKPIDQKLDFQTLELDNSKDLLLRLENLYKKGIKEFLNIDMNWQNQEQKLDNLLTTLNIDNDKINNIKKWVEDQSLNNSDDFKFQEVYDKESLRENEIVVEELVRLMQPYKFRYGHKQQFLSDFFELFLDTGFKQEQGQFFTPLPLARMMVQALPIKEKLNENIKKGEIDFVPKMVDYSSGSGHFIIEYLDYIQKKIDNISTKALSNRQSKKVSSYKIDPYSWASDTYGVEIDYRLVKTAKLNTFLNGDGDANIIRSNALDKFNSDNFNGLLSNNSKSSNNQQFDFIISNPPYSVSGFKLDLPNLKESFPISSDFVNNDSKQIETLFIERAAQLLKPNGFAALILPYGTFANKDGLSKVGRDILLQQFKIFGIVNLPRNTFMETGIEANIIFIEKRDNNEYLKSFNSIKDAIKQRKDITLNQVNNVINSYLKDNGINRYGLNGYIDWLYNPKDTNFDYIYSKQYIDNDNLCLSSAQLIELESKKIAIYSMSQNNIAYIKSGNGSDAGKQFLGYKFKKRNFAKTIAPYNSNHTIDELTYLYTSNDNKKNVAVDKIIHDIILKNSNISKNKYTNIYKVSDLIDWEESYTPFITSNKLIELKTKSNSDYYIPLGPLVNIRRGTPLTKDNSKKGDIPVVAGGKDKAFKHNKSNRPAGTITVAGSGANAGFVNKWDEPIWASDSLTIELDDNKLKENDFPYDEDFKQKLNNLIVKEGNIQLKLRAHGAAQKHVYERDIAKIIIPKSIINNY